MAAGCADVCRHRSETAVSVRPCGAGKLAKDLPCLHRSLGSRLAEQSQPFRSASGKKILGNAQIPNSLNIPDPDNNVEAVRIENVPVGTYLIQVTASNLLKGPQDFALVVTGENVSTLVPI